MLKGIGMKLKVKEMLLKIESNKEEIKRLTEENTKLSIRVMTKLQQKSLKNYMLEDDDSILSATIVEKNKLEFNLDLLKSKLGKSTYKEIIEKNIEIDKAELRELFEKNPNLKKQIKPALIITDTLDENKLKQLIDEEVITKEDIEGTYDITKSSYLRVARKMIED